MPVNRLLDLPETLLKGGKPHYWSVRLSQSVTQGGPARYAMTCQHSPVLTLSYVIAWWSLDLIRSRAWRGNLLLFTDRLDAERVQLAFPHVETEVCPAPASALKLPHKVVERVAITEAICKGGAQQLYIAKLVSSPYTSNPYYNYGTCYASLTAIGHNDYARLDLPLKRGARIKLFSSMGAAEDFLQAERAGCLFD